MKLLGFFLLKCMYLSQYVCIERKQSVRDDAQAAFTAALRHTMHWHFVLMSLLPLPSRLLLTSTLSVGLLFPKRDSDKRLLPHRCPHRASDEDSLYEIRAHLFHRSCHWHALLHCRPAAPARGLPPIRTRSRLHLFICTTP